MSQSLKTPLVSIIIPTYGRPDVLKKSIDSVLKQTYSNLEIIVVDDNNPNTEHRRETEQLMSKNYMEVKNVIYLKHKQNKNGSAARNTGLAESRGKYICFLDDDDYYLDGKLNQQVNFLNNHPDFDAVYSGYRVNGENYYQYFEGQLIKELLLMDYEPVTSSLMFRIEAIESINGFDESFIRHQDYELMLRFFKKHKVSFIDEVLIEKGRTTDANIVRGGKLEELKDYFLRTFDDEISDLDHENPGLKNEIYSRHFSYVFLTHMNHGYYKRGIKVFFKYFFKFPIVFTKDISTRVFKYFN